MTMSVLNRAVRFSSTQIATGVNPKQVMSSLSKSRRFASSLPVVVPVPVPAYAKKLGESRILTRIDLTVPQHRSGYGAPIKGIICDSAGTVQGAGVKSVTRAFQELYRTHAGIELSEKEAGAPTGKSKKAHNLAILFSESIKERFKAKHGRYPTEEDGALLYKHFPKIQMDILAQEKFRRPITGLKETMMNVRERGCVVMSNTGFGSCMDILLDQSMQEIYGPDLSCDAEQVLRGRPEADMVLLLLAQANLAPSHVVKIGDTTDDVLEGLRANTWTVALSLTSVYTHQDEAELSKLDPKRLREINELSVKQLASVQPHFIADGIWEYFAIHRHIDLMSRKGFHPFDFPVQETKDPLSLYKPARIPKD